MPRHTASAVFLVLLSLHLLTFQETLRVDDEYILAARAQSLALWGRLEQPQAFSNQRERELQVMGAAAMDACGNLNATVIGDWEHPKVRHHDRGCQ